MAAVEQTKLQQNGLAHIQRLSLKNTPRSIGFECCLAKSSLYIFSPWVKKKARRLGGRLVAYR